ncbi:MAG TPA: ATPase domain-containing protein [Patescibacteria group bacterium]|nr:ATPase domain-containing protein [Patescibacteria group bacterium]
MKKQADDKTTVNTGNAELDDILGGGLTHDRVYLLQGSPGAGKTTLALQFLIAGAEKGETVLYLTLSESETELKAVAASHNWSLDNINICELLTTEEALQAENQYTMYQPAEVELGVTTETIIGEVGRLKPRRVVLDSLSELKLLAQSPLRFRRQILALKKFFGARDCTVLFLDDKTATGAETFQLESIVHGVIDLEQLSPEYGADRRRLRVKKFRGRKYRGGFHDFSILTGGVYLFPRLVPAEHLREQEKSQVGSGIPEIDKLVGGGVEEGTSVLLLGPAGVGKSTLGLQYAVNAAAQGKHAVIFTFDESISTMLHRAEGIGMPLKKYIDAGLIHCQPIDPTEMSPGEFAHCVRDTVGGENGGVAAKVVVIDSLNGYLNAMPEERFLLSQMHELLTYLGHHGVVTFLVVAQHGLLGHSMQTPLDTSYLADSVILFRYFEVDGHVRQAISVLKKRSGSHEKTIREFKIGPNGITVGEPLSNYHGVLTGTPVKQN